MALYSIAERVINVHTTKPFQWVLDNVFSESVCGRRNAALFWKSTGNSCHFFIEFAHKDSVPIAQREAIPGVTVHCLSRNMNMIGIFDCLSKGIEPPRKRLSAEADSATAEPQDSNRSFSPTAGPTHRAKRQRIYEHDKPSRPSTSPFFRDTYHKSFPSPYPRDPSQRNYATLPKTKPAWAPNSEPRHYQNSTQNFRKTRFRNNDFHNSNGSSHSPPHRPQYRDEHREERVHAFSYRNAENKFSGPPRRRQSDASPPHSPISFDPTPTPTPAPAPPYVSTPARQSNPNSDPSRLPDLDSMGDNNVEAVIESLKMWMSGPDTWITVAAHYRRRKLHESALRVVSMMIQVMEDRGMKKADLKPALLLMAQCHYSLAKQKGDGDNVEESNRHFVILLDWLRETYGTNTPAVDAIAQLDLSTTESPDLGDSWTTEKENKPFLPYDDSSKRTSYLMRDPLRPVPGTYSFQAPPPSTVRIDNMTEELNTLRAAHASTMSDLVAARAAKFQAEKMLEDEVSKRRKAEGELRIVREEERVARARALRESDSRKRTEERLVQERQAWDRRAEEIKDEAARGVVQDMSAILALSSSAPASILGATRALCEARARAGAADMS